MNSKLIYIAGGGHSGSTLLDLIIGSSSNVMGLGELHFFNSYNYDLDDPKLYDINKRVCSCGKEFENCEFWSDVKRDTGKKIDISRFYTFWETVKTIWNIICPFEVLRFDVGNIDYQILVQSILRVCKRNGQSIDYLLDSSKDPRSLLKLESVFGKDKLKVIFLVRDIRGYVNSYSNSDKWRVKDAGLKPENFLRVAIRWLFVNLSITVYTKLHNIECVKIVYDEFCQNPDRTLQALNEKWGVNISDDYIEEIHETEYHNIHGNLMKFSQIKSIRWDKSWAKQLPKWKKIIIDIFFGWANYWFVLSELKEK